MLRSFSVSDKNRRLNEKIELNAFHAMINMTNKTAHKNRHEFVKKFDRSRS